MYMYVVRSVIRAIARKNGNKATPMIQLSYNVFSSVSLSSFKKRNNKVNKNG